MKSTIKLFKALPIEGKKKKTDKVLMKETIKRGFIFAPEVVAEYPDTKHLIELIDDVFGMSAERLNSSFHKSWKKVATADIEQLIVEQIMHYITTYGFERLGIYDKDSVYIPMEELDIPKLKSGNLKLVIIKGYTKKELKQKLMDLLNLGIALAEDTKDDVLDVVTYVDINKTDVEKIKNKEVKIALYEYLNIIPRDSLEFLRFAVYKATNETLLIKNPILIGKIKENDNLNIIKLFSDYEKEYGLEPLAEIFYRFKPIFLAFRGRKKLNVSINKIRRLAKTNHKPMPEDYLNTVTAKLKDNKKIIKKTLVEELSKVNIFRKIRLAYALKYRTKSADGILYKVRNGKGYAKEFDFKNIKGAKETLKIVTDSIVEDVKKNVKGKKIYIPKYVNYALPATEKQYIGYFPSGTYITIPKDMIIGINWNNLESRRIDLDLSLESLEHGKVGWDSSYRTGDRKTLFSGDITDASGKNGATELFYVGRQDEDKLILFLNYYNFDENSEVPFKIIVASENVKDFGENYMVNPNNLLSTVGSKINKRQKMLGLVVTNEKENRFYFTETNIGNNITAINKDYTEYIREYLFKFNQDSINLKDILEEAGAKLVEKKDRADIDLSPENLEKDSILELIK